MYVEDIKYQKPPLCVGIKKYDGTKESLMDKSHRPLTPHPNSHTEEELRWIKNLIKRNPSISIIELYAKLKVKKEYKHHPCSLFRILRKLGFFKNSKKKVNTYKPKPYNTPTSIGEKWQLDVKYVPKKCYVGQMPDKFYQYTIIDEATRERYIYPFKEHSSYSTVQFVKMAIDYFGYKPKIIQTDNGMMESFFGILKSEMFYGLENTFNSLDELALAIEEYIFYYNNKRIKSKLKGLSPVHYRTKSYI